MVGGSKERLASYDVCNYFRETIHKIVNTMPALIGGRFPLARGRALCRRFSTPVSYATMIILVVNGSLSSLSH